MVEATGDVNYDDLQTRADNLAAKANKQLGWEPTVDFKGLVHMMVDADIARLEAGHLVA